MRKKMSSGSPGHGEPNDEVSMISATRRINEIIADADRQAGQIIVSAEVEARQYLAKVKAKTDQEAVEYARAMAALSEALIDQAEALRGEADRLLAELGESEGDPERESGAPLSAAALGDPAADAGAEPGPADAVRAEPAPVDVAPAAPAPEPKGPTEEFSAGARLLATQMAVAGSTRGDIHDRLANDFGIKDPKPLLDSILGPMAEPGEGIDSLPSKR